VRTSFHDLEEARQHLAALKELLLQEDRSDAHISRRIRALCCAAHAALRDPYCSHKIARLAERAALWCARPAGKYRDDHYLDQILDFLSLIESRIATIEAIRRASRSSITH
jgi:hypothetical protein